MQFKSAYLLKAIGADPYTKLLLHAEGAEGSTTLQDSSIYNHTVYVGGNTKINNTLSKFGLGSIDVNESVDSDYFYAYGEAFSFGVAPFTVDFWIRVRSKPSTVLREPIYDAQVLNGGADRAGAFMIEMDYQGRIRITSGAGVTAFSSAIISTNVWTHIAIIRDLENAFIKVYINGSLAITDLSTYAITAGGFVIGRTAPNVRGYINACFDEIRISKGIARWTANFTPPVAPY